MMTLVDAIHWAQGVLNNSDARVDAEYLVMAAVGCTRTTLFSHPEKILSAEQTELLNSWISRRQTGEPVAYILGMQGFWSLDLEVSPVTLIPRPDTELLVELVLHSLTSIPKPKILDLGTGTGAIALALARERPDAQVVGTDWSQDILDLAERNRQKHQLPNVRWQQSDWWQSVTGQFHLIVSNPPYIAPQDEHLSQGGLRFEPRTALVAKNDGLADLKTIIESAQDFLMPAGQLWVEHGWQQAAAVQALFKQNGFARVATHIDLAGHQRVTMGVSQNGT